jgi:hypothetical protein
MRYQERTYIGSPIECIRNKSMYNVSCSSDIDVFTPPIFSVDGTSTASCVYNSIEFSGTPYTTILSAATSACTITATCFSYSVWRLDVSENGQSVSSGGTGFWTGTTYTGDTPTDTALGNALNNSFSSLSYDYYYDNLLYNIRKPYGASGLTVSLCVDLYFLTDGAFCTGGTCSNVCTEIGSTTYPVLTSGSTGVYVLDRDSDDTDFDFEFNFTDAQFSAFTGDRKLKFRYEVFKFSTASGSFRKPTLFNAGYFDSTEIKYDKSGGYSLSQKIPHSSLSLDGDYLIKGYFQGDTLTDYGKRLGQKVDTSKNKSGTDNKYYNPASYRDWYFSANYKAETPNISLSAPNQSQLGDLTVGTIYISCQSATTATTICNTGTTYVLGTDISGDVLVSLNGEVLSVGVDYSLSASTSITGKRVKVVELFTGTTTGDVITYAFVSGGDSGNFKYETIDIDYAIVSGATGGQGDNNVYYNTTTSKYELYTEITPASGNDIYVTVNGATLANNIDYYQSTSVAKRIILEGTVLSGDVINMYYNSLANVSDDIFNASHIINWNIDNAPEESNGFFTLEVDDFKSFTAITQSATTNYVAGQHDYTSDITFSGDVNTVKYYRVKNTKEYRTMCGDKIISEAYSEIVPITIRYNSINSY